MRRSLVQAVVVWGAAAGVVLANPPLTGSASWYGDERRGKLMADGRPFDPEKLTAASWFYPLGTKVTVSVTGATNSVEVTITDRGPSKALVSQGRIIDLSRAAFERLCDPDRGLVSVTVKK